MGPKSVAIVGCGLSGVLTAIHLLAGQDKSLLRLYLIEKREHFGLGAAYSTDNPGHLLNVRASNMSVFPDQPDHFLEWLREHPEIDCPTPCMFVPRKVFGAYLQSILRRLAYGPAAANNLFLVADEAVRVAPRDGGYSVRLAMGKDIDVDAVVLATGNLPPEPPATPDGGFFSTRHFVADPWSANALDFVRPADSVLLLGTGLTMVDLAISLSARGHLGRIVALSRRGLLPRRHDEEMKPAAHPAPALPADLSKAVAGVRAAIRAAAEEGVDWRQVIDSLRPFVREHWSRLSREQQARFVRHLRPWWDAHRHRMAPQIAAQIEALRSTGRLVVHAGSLVRVAPNSSPGSSLADVTWRPRGKREESVLRVHHIINCMGPSGDPRRSRMPLYKSLVEQGLARPCPLRLGLDVDGDGRLLNAQGAVQSRLFALGPPTRGAFWEITAVPDIRVQAKVVASRLLDAEPHSCANGAQSAAAIPI
ncbi:MAG: FAD/NAD(P)-binding protein [Hyphomicrobiales bacterium]|nr:FAD/NAD(P)-binding protein [Hyphomicrobiales bacterium]